jgi:hypothetical protein
MISAEEANVAHQPVCDCLHYTETGPIPATTCLRCLGTGRTDPRRDATLQRNHERRTPTEAEQLAFDGAHCRKLYAGLPSNWRCPGCGRNKYQLIRWTMLYPHRSDRHPGWAAGLHKHHDHGRGMRRFPETVICEQCNSADASAKRELRLPADFSFSPHEIAQFVVGTPHGWHLINYAAAARVYELARIPPPPLIPSMFWNGGDQR